MNAKTLIRFAPMLAALALLAGIRFAGAAVHEGGQVTIGVPLPQLQLGQGADAAEPLRQTVMNRLRAPGVEIVALTGSTPAEIDADAKAKGCSQVLYTHVEQKHGVGGLFSKFASVASVLPVMAAAGGGGGGGGGGGLTGLLTQTAANAATNAAASAAQKQMMGAQQQMLGAQQQVLAEQQPALALQNAARTSIKRGDNISFDYRLVAVGSAAPLRSDTLRAKADADGQDVLTPLIEQLGNAVSTDPQGAGGSAGSGSGGGGGAAANATSPGAGEAEHTGFMHGLFGSHDKSASRSATASAPTGGGMPDCAQMASMPNAPFSFEACQKMAGAQQAYDRALADPSASRPGDEQMSCEQILAELRQQQISAPDKAKVAETTAAATKEQALLNKHMAESTAIMAEEQAKVDAAAAVDRATGGLVNTAGAAAEAAQARAKVVGKRQAEERRPTEQKLMGGVADLGMDAAQQLTTNPRLARLMQLAQAHGCKGI